MEKSKQIVRLKLAKSVAGRLSYNQFQLYDNKLILLTSFLSADISLLDEIADLKEWILDQKSVQIGYEGTELIKEGDVICLYDAYFKDGTDPDFFTLSQESFLHVLDEWEKVLTLMPLEVTIAQDEDKIRFEYEVCPMREVLCKNAQELY